MAKFRVKKGMKGFYKNVMHIHDGPHEVFDAPDDWCVNEEGKFKCSWAEPADRTAQAEEPEADDGVVIDDGTVLSADKPESEGPDDLVGKTVEDEGVEVL